MLSALIGLVVSIIAFFGLIMWWNEFLIIFKGFIPISFIFGGIVGIISGISGWRKKINK